MNILAVDTSTNVLNVTIKKDDLISEYNEENGTSQHSELLLPQIIKQCEELKIQLKDLDLMICTRGPGSFTGLRIGMACLKGLSYGLDKPLVSVSTLTAYASTIKDYDGAIVVALDAKKQRYYLAVFEVKNGEVKRITQDIDGNTPDLEQALTNYDRIAVVGPDKEAFVQQMKEFYKESKNIECLEAENQSFGSILIDLGIQQYNAKGADDIGQGPVYIRKSDAEVALEERLRTNK